MQPQPKAPFIFDVEGTLVDCVPETLACWQVTLQNFGFDIDEDELQPLSGMDPKDMLHRLVPEIEEQQLKDIIKQQGENYKRRYLHQARRLRGVPALLGSLKRAGHKIALATTCDAKELTHYRQLMEVDSFIDVIACGDDVKRGKPHPDLFELAVKRLRQGNAVVIGDTPFDAKAAAALNLPSIGVLTGGFSENELVREGAAVVPDVAALLEHQSWLEFRAAAGRSE